MKATAITETLVTGDINPVAYTGQNKGLLGLSGIATPLRIEKRWGYELIYRNTDLYCCKQLYIREGFSTSFHLHLEKHETLLVVDGTLYIDIIDNKIHKTIIVKENQAFVMAPGLLHSLRAQDEAVTLVEASTPSYDTDSIRVKDGE